jgi:hypothetical protein
MRKKPYTYTLLRAWAGPTAGYGYISNITYENVHIENTDAPIVLDQCYFNINSSTCAAYPSNVNISLARHQGKMIELLRT